MLPLLLAATLLQPPAQPAIPSPPPTPPAATPPAEPQRPAPLNPLAVPFTPATHTRNVFLIMLDGLRWQEVFTGADERLIHKDHGVTDTTRVKAEYLRPTPKDRRRAILPFLWSTAEDPARAGLIIGDMTTGSSATITNAYKVSYPGYAEVLCGFTQDASIKDNRRLWNPHPTVFEYLHDKPGFTGKVAAFGAWDVFPWIFNTQRCGFPVDDGLNPLTFGTTSPAITAANTLRAEIPRRWSASTFDALLFRPALEWITLNRPSAVFICLGETDEWAHENMYGHYLDSARRADGYIKELWDWCQRTEGYKDATTFIITCDHGRGGDNPPGYTGGQLKQWTDHNPKVIGAEQTWIMIFGPDTPPMASRPKDAPPPTATQNQIAATLAALLGHDYAKDQPKAARQIEGAIRSAPVRPAPDKPVP